MNLKPFLGALAVVAGIVVMLGGHLFTGLVLVAVGLAMSILYTTSPTEEHVFGPDFLDRCVEQYETLIRNTEGAEQVSVEKGSVSGEPTDPYYKPVVTVPGHRISAWIYGDGAQFVVDGKEGSRFEWQDYQEAPTGEKLIQAFLYRLEGVRGSYQTAVRTVSLLTPA